MIEVWHIWVRRFKLTAGAAAAGHDDPQYAVLAGNTSIAIAFGLTSAGFWGASDLLARYSTRNVGPFRTLYIGQVIGLAMLSVYAAFTGGFASAAGVAWQPWAWSVAAAVLFNTATLCLYRAFETGTLAIVSPISASYAVVSAALSFAFGERLDKIAILGIALVLIGIPFAASVHTVDAPGLSLDEMPEHRVSSSGIGWALISALGYGISFWIYGYMATPKLGGTLPVWVNYAVSSVLLAFGFLRPAERKVPGRGPLLVAASGGTLAVLGTFFDITGISTGHVALVTTLSSLYSTITVVLAAVILKEALSPKQWMGVALVLAGVALVRQ